MKRKITIETFERQIIRVVSNVWIEGAQIVASEAHNGAEPQARNTLDHDHITEPATLRSTSAGENDNEK